MKLIELLDRSVSWFEFELIVKQNRWFSLTMRSHFWPLFAIFLQKMNFWSSKRCISWSNSRTNLIFDSGRIWDCIFFRKWKEVVKKILGLEQAYKIMPQKLRLFKVQNLFDNLFDHTIQKKEVRQCVLSFHTTCEPIGAS